MKISLKRILLTVLACILALVLIAAAAVGVVWHNEIATLLSIKQIHARNDANIEGSVYHMDVSGDYYFDEFLKQGGVKSDSELIAYMTSHLTRGLMKNAGITESSIGCSTFTAALANGDRVFARNYDFTKTNTMIVTTKARGDRHATISTADLQFLGLSAQKDPDSLMNRLISTLAVYVPLDGINDAGVSMSIHMSYQGTTETADGKTHTVATDVNTNKPDITSTTMIRLVLDYADDLDEAIRLIETYDLHDSANTSYHYVIGDASGRSAILEWAAGTNETDNDGGARQLVVTYNDADADIGEAEAAAETYQWATNFIILPGYYSNEKDMQGLDRYQHIASRLQATDGVLADENAALAILQEVGRRTWNPNGRACTVHSVVYNLTQRTVTWVANEHFGEADAVFHYSFK